MTFSIAASRSFSVIAFLRALIANIPASVHTLLMSAPVVLGQSLRQNQPVPGKQLEPDVPLHTHRPGVDLKDVRPALEVGERKFDLAVESPGAELARGAVIPAQGRACRAGSWPSRL